MRIPDSLQKGGTIGFAAPSFGCNIEPYKTAFDNAVGKFEKMGYKIIKGPNCYEGSGVGISNTPKRCADEINSFCAEKIISPFRRYFRAGAGNLCVRYWMMWILTV